MICVYDDTMHHRVPVLHDVLSCGGRLENLKSLILKLVVSNMLNYITVDYVAGRS